MKKQCEMNARRVMKERDMVLSYLISIMNGTGDLKLFRNCAAVYVFNQNYYDRALKVGA